MFSHAKRIRMTCDTLMAYGEEHGTIDSAMAEMIGFIRGAAYGYQTDEEKGIVVKKRAEVGPWGINLSTEMHHND